MNAANPMAELARYKQLDYGLYVPPPATVPTLPPATAPTAPPATITTPAPTTAPTPAPTTEPIYGDVGV